MEEAGLGRKGANVCVGSHGPEHVFPGVFVGRHLQSDELPVRLCHGKGPTFLS